MTINAIRIAEDGTVTEHTVNGLDDLQALVGGYIEGFGTSEQVENLGLWAYCNEEGRMNGMVSNPVAARVCGHVPPFADTLYGPIIFTRPDDYNEETDEEIANPPITPEQIDGLRRLTLTAL